MDLDLVLDNVNKLSQQVSVLQEYIQLKFGSDFKEFQKFKESNPKVGMIVVPEDQQSFSRGEGHLDDPETEEYADWDKGITPRVTNVFKLEEEVEDYPLHQEEPHNSSAHPPWNNNIHEGHEGQDGEEVQVNPHGDDFFVDNLSDDKAEVENCVEYSTEEIECMPSSSPPILDWMGHPDKSVMENGQGGNDVQGQSQGPGQSVKTLPRFPNNIQIPRRRPIIKRQIHQVQDHELRAQVQEEMKHMPKYHYKWPRSRTGAKKMRPKFSLPPVLPSVTETGPYRHAQYGLLYRMSDRGEKMVVNDYFFRVNKHDKKSGKTYWVCVNKICPARVAQDAVGRPIMSREHIHLPPNPADMKLLD